MEEKKKLSRGIWIGIGIGAFAALILIIVLINPLMKFHSTSMELGSQVDTDIHNYLRGTEGMISSAKLDTSQVDPMHIGDYKATVATGPFIFEYTIKIQDTTAPIIKPKKEVYIGLGQSIQASQIIESTSDLGGEVAVTMEDKKSDSFIPEALGTKTVIIAATDPSGNTATASIDCMVEKPPYFIGVKDNSIKLNSSFEPGDYVVAFDDNFGDLTADMKVEKGDFDPKAAGSYTVSFSVTNPHGISSMSSEALTVQNQEELMTNPISKEEISLLCDIEFFKTKQVEDENHDKLLNTVAPTLLDLYTDNCKGRVISVAGSGTIFDIDSEYLYICTNNHVTRDINNNGNDISFIFFNGYRITGHSQLEPIKLEDDNIDLSMIKLPISEIPTDLLLKLRKVNYDIAISDNMPVGKKLTEYAKNWHMGSRDQVKDVTVKHWSDMSQRFIDFVGKYKNDYFLSTTGAIGGMSGTGIFDSKGVFVGIVSHVARSGNESADISVMASRIVTLLQKAKAA